MMRMISLALVLLCVVAANATQVKPRELSKLVSESDHIIIAKVTKVQMVDENENEVTDPEGRTGPGLENEIRLHVTITKDGILKTTKDNPPEKLVIPLWKWWHFTLGNRKELEGKTLIFLLKGEDFQSVYPMLFIRQLSEKREIVRLSREDSNLVDLSGVFRAGEENMSSPYLELDGASGRFDLRGDILKDVPAGTRIWVKGIIQTQLHKPEGNASHQQTGYWGVFMVVKEFKKISKPFEKPKY